MEGQYAIYLRKSRADIEAEALGEGETLARHKNILMKLAEKHEILPEQITIYQEIVSGESIADRPQIQKLLSDVYQKKYKGVLVVEIERLARGNTIDQGEVANAFQYSNTKIITPVKIYDPNNEFDQEYFEFGLFMSRREYKTIKRRMEAGRLESVAEGNYVGSLRPYGYDIKRVNKKERILVVNPYEAQYVKMMFNWFTNDKISSGEIARRLTELKVPTLTGKNEWNRGTVKDILQNVHYTGMVRWNRRRCSKEYDAESNSMLKKKRRLTPDDYKVYKGKHEAIISDEQFELAQSLFVGQVPVKANETIINPLTGLMYCAKCGKTMKLRAFYGNNKALPRYAHGESKAHTAKSCEQSVVIDAVVDGLKQYLDDFQVKIELGNNNIEQEQHMELIHALEAELQKQETKRRKLFDAFEEGVYTNQEFIERKSIVNESVDSIKKQIQDAKENAPGPINYEDKIVSLHQAIDLLKDGNVDAKSKNLFLKQIIDHIDYDAEDLGRGKGTRPILDIYLL